MVVPKVGSNHRDWQVMIAYLVINIEVSGRAVSPKDLAQLKRWKHNHSAVLRRAIQASTDVPLIEETPSSRGCAAQVAGGAKKKAKVLSAETRADDDRMSRVPALERKGPRFFDPHGPPTEGDFASAGRRASVPEDGEGTLTASGLRSPYTAQSKFDAPQKIFLARHFLAHAKIILAAARRELASARAVLDVLGGTIADCTAAAPSPPPVGTWGYQHWRRP